MQTVLEVTGLADAPALQRAVDTVCRAHPHLLCGFERNPCGGAVSIERRGTVPRLRAVDLRAYPRDQREAAALRLEEHERYEEFSLATPPLIRLLLILTGDRERRLVVTSHRLLLDDWSHAALIRAVLAAFCTGSGTRVADRSGAARPCSLAGRSHEVVSAAIRGPDLRSETYTDCEFDLAAASGAQSPVRLSRAVPAEVIRRIHGCAVEQGFDPQSVVHGAWAFALAGLTGRSQVAFTTAVADSRTGSAGDPGPIDVARAFLPLTVPVRAARSSIDLVRAVSRHSADLAAQLSGGAIDQLEYSADQFEYSAPRVPFENVADTVAVLEPEPIGPITPRLGIRINTLSTSEAKPFPLSFSVVPGPAWIARLDYQAAVLPPRVAESVLTGAMAFLEMTAYAPHRPLERIDGWSAAQGRSVRAA